MRDWILSVTCCGIVAAMIQMLLPKGLWKQIGVLAGGALMILTVVEPIVKLDFDAAAAELDRIAGVQMEKQEDLSQRSMDSTGEIIRDEYRAYILERAQELGVSCEVSVICEESAEMIPIPVRIIVTEIEGEENAAELLQVIKHDFGITAELPDVRGEDSG